MGDKSPMQELHSLEFQQQGTAQMLELTPSVLRWNWKEASDNERRFPNTLKKNIVVSSRFMENQLSSFSLSRPFSHVGFKNTWKIGTTPINVFSNGSCTDWGCSTLLLLHHGLCLAEVLLTAPLAREVGARILHRNKLHQTTVSGWSCFTCLLLKIYVVCQDDVVRCFRKEGSQSSR